MGVKRDAGGLAAATIVAKNYLPFARVLAKSLERHHPKVPFLVALVDEAEGFFEPASESFECVALDDLGIPDLALFRFRYSMQEVAAAAKPYLLRYLLDRGFRAALFLDADILILGALDDLLRRVERRAMVLTPHLAASCRGERSLSRELNVLQCGVFNGGCIGVSETEETRRFLRWWQECVLYHCRHAIDRGIFFDQRWLDFAPGFVADLEVMRDPALNAAYWNLPERSLRMDGDRVLVGDRPCAFFHFSGFDPSNANSVTCYWPELRWAEGEPAARLFREYASLVLAEGYDRSKDWPYTWDRFDNGVPVPVVARHLVEEMGEAARRFGDPFAAGGADSFYRWLGGPADEDPYGQVTRLWWGVYRGRADVRKAYPDALGRDRDGFLEWMRNSGAREHGISDGFLPAEREHPLGD